MYKYDIVKKWSFYIKVPPNIFLPCLSLTLPIPSAPYSFCASTSLLLFINDWKLRLFIFHVNLFTLIFASSVPFAAEDMISGYLSHYFSFFVHWWKVLAIVGSAAANLRYKHLFGTKISCPLGIIPGVLEDTEVLLWVSREVSIPISIWLY